MWFMEEDLDSSKIMLGLSQAAGGVFGIVTMALAGPVMRKFGHIRIFALAILLYSPRYLGMSFIPRGQAYWVCVAQIGEAFSHSLVKITSAFSTALLQYYFQKRITEKFFDQITQYSGLFVFCADDCGRSRLRWEIIAKIRSKSAGNYFRSALLFRWAHIPRVCIFIPSFCTHTAVKLALGPISVVYSIFSIFTGKGGGSLIGGQILSHFGARVAFRSFAVAWVFVPITYCII